MIVNLTAGNVMDKAAAHLNDVAKAKYTYAVQIPYLNTALQELEENFALENIPSTDILSAELALTAGATSISRTTIPALPSNFIEPVRLWEKTTGNNSYGQMTPVKSLVSELGTTTNRFGNYTWGTNKIGLLPASNNITILIEYIGSLFVPITASTDAINVINAQTFLEFRTAGLCAKFIDEDNDRANELNGNAGLSLDRTLSIGAKGRQNIVTRRRPFRAAYRRR